MDNIGKHNKTKLRKGKKSELTGIPFFGWKISSFFGEFCWPTHFHFLPSQPSFNIRGKFQAQIG
jgi:hypothetical protein